MSSNSRAELVSLIRTLASIAMVGSLCFGCAGDEPPSDCAEFSEESCVPQYQPTFQNVFDRTLAPSCAVAGGACHATEGAEDRLALEPIDVAYENLVGDGVVVAFDAACSPLAARLYHSDPAQQMPPGRPLDERERCAIRQWIDEGAAR